MKNILFSLLLIAALLNSANADEDGIISKVWKFILTAWNQIVSSFKKEVTTYSYSYVRPLDNQMEKR